MRLARLALPLLAFVVGGCSIFGNDDEAIAPPMELTDFRESLELRRTLSVKLGDGSEDLRLALAPAGDGTRVYAASVDGRVHAFDAASDKRVWETRLKLDLSAGPGVGEGMVVVASNNGTIVALDARTGSELWRRDILAEVLAPPVIGASRVVIRTVDGRLVAMSADDGSQQWLFEQPVPRLSQRGIAAPIIAGNTVVAGFDNGRVMAVSLLEGEVQWELPLAIPAGRTDIDRMVDIDGHIAAAGQDVYVAGFQGRTAAIALESGNGLWAREISSHSGIGVDWGNIYVTADDDRIVALTRSTGAQAWTQENLLRRELTAPVPYGEQVVVGDFEGYLHFLDARTGVLAARERVDNSRISGEPYVMGDKIYAQTESGTLHAYRRRTGG
jgi:outer membrane protein assembly factor BamB